MARWKHGDTCPRCGLANLRAEFCEVLGGTVTECERCKHRPNGSDRAFQGAA